PPPPLLPPSKRCYPLSCGQQRAVLTRHPPTKTSPSTPDPHSEGSSHVPGRCQSLLPSRAARAVEPRSFDQLFNSTLIDMPTHSRPVKRTHPTRQMPPLEESHSRGLRTKKPTASLR